MNTLTNSEFCYWLQGYFEISEQSYLDKTKIISIDKKIRCITHEFGPFTKWLSMVMNNIIYHNFDAELIARFTPIIQKQLNLIFLHVIDPSYNSDKSPDELKKIHDGDTP
jgi:hypothetical protein